MKKLLAGLIIPFLLSTFMFNPELANAQSDSSLSRLKSFVQNINTFNTLLPQEKVYLHFDNTSYFLGEHIWFKVNSVKLSNKTVGQTEITFDRLVN